MGAPPSTSQPPHSPCHRHPSILTHTHSLPHTYIHRHTAHSQMPLTDMCTLTHTRSDRHTPLSQTHPQTDVFIYRLPNTPSHTHTGSHPRLPHPHLHTRTHRLPLTGVGRPPEADQLHGLVGSVQMHLEVPALPRVDPTVQAGGATDASHPPQPGLPQGAHCAHLRRDLEQGTEGRATCWLQPAGWGPHTAPPCSPPRPLSAVPGSLSHSGRPHCAHS